MDIITELITIIRTKNSWGKNELLTVLLELLAENYDNTHNKGKL